MILSDTPGIIKQYEMQSVYELCGNSLKMLTFCLEIEPRLAVMKRR
jgi:hypothetical protein